MKHDELASLIDHTILKPEAKESDIRRLCEEAKEYHFASVCINPSWVSLCDKLLKEDAVRVCTVVGFPLGANLTKIKLEESRLACEEGASEIDMVLNIGWAKMGSWAKVLSEIQEIARLVKGEGACLKVILETALLTEEEKERACSISQEAGADFVKTSTGFSSGGATVEDIQLMRRVVGPEMGVKASGGIRTLESALAMLEAGATRLGVSAGIEIVTSLPSL